MNRRIPFLLALLSSAICASQVQLAAFEYFSVPVETTVSSQALGGGEVHIDWNVAGSVPTVFWMIPSPQSPDNRPVIAPPLSSEEDAAGWAKEFIDAHPEFFAVPSTEFELVGVDSSWPTWGITVRQTYQGLWVLGASLSINVTRADGVLSHIAARLFPAADLEGLDPVPAASAEKAAAAAVAVHGEGAMAFDPELRVAFRGVTPFLAWRLEVVDVTVPPLQRESWLYLVAGDTGEVLAVARLGTSLESRLFLRGDGNGDGEVDIGDPLSVLFDLFVTPSGSSCADAGDANDDGRVTSPTRSTASTSSSWAARRRRGPFPDRGPT